MKHLIPAAFIIALSLLACSQPSDFSDPGQEYRPHVRMWIPMAAEDESELRAQIKDLAKAGFGDVEIVAFDVARGGPAQQGPSIPADVYGWGTAAWSRTMKTVLDEAGKNGIKATFTIGPAWPVASPLLEEDFPGVEVQLACDRTDMKGVSFEESFPDDAFAVVAGKRKAGSADLDPATLVNITETAVKDGKVSWKAPDGSGLWSILVYRNERVGETKGGFYVVDHLSLAGTQSVIDYYTPIFEELRGEGLLKYLNGLFGDSLEYRASVDWTLGFEEVFKSLKGYDIVPFLPAVHNGVGNGGGGIFGGGFGKDGLDGIGDAVLNDYYSVVTYLFNENHLKPLQSFLEQYGASLRYQTAYGKYMEQASTSMHVGIPEGEMMMIRNSFDNIRAQAGAVHVAGRKEYNAELQAESGKNHAQSWQNLLFFAQRTFAAGVNNITLHGYNYSGRFSGPGNVDGYVPGVGWPGWEGFGREGYSNSWGAEPLWEMAPAYTGFIARNGYVLKQGRPAVDLAVFRESYWDNASFTENQDGSYWYRDGALLQDGGWSYDFIGLPQFETQQTRVSDGRLYPDGPAYKALIVDQSLDTHNEPYKGGKRISLESARHILSLAQAGLPVIIVGGSPLAVSHYSELQGGEELVAVVAQLESLPTVKRAASFSDIPATLSSLGLYADASYVQAEDAPKFISLHRALEGIDYFYVYNRGFNSNGGMQYGWGYGKEKELPYGAASVTIAFHVSGTPYRLDAWTGKIERITDAVTEGDTVLIPVSLEGNESAIIAFDRKGAFAGAPDAQTLDPSSATSMRLGRWELDVEAWNPGEDKAGVVKEHVKATLEGLKPWTEIPGLESASGIGRYSTTVELKKVKGAILDLGTVNYSWRVFVNGKEVPCSQTNTKIDISKYLRRGKNNIEVEVATTLNNRIKAMMPPAQPRSGAGPGGGMPMMGRGGRTSDPYGLLGRDGEVELLCYE